jgi:hypothetical protein
MSELLQVEWDMTEGDLKEYQKSINQNSDVRYVFYNPETGLISSITNSYNNEIEPHVTVPFSQVKSILEGNDLYTNFKVVFSPDEKDFILIKKDEEEEVLTSINDIIFQIPFSVDTTVPLIYDTMNDLTFIQDYEDTCWKIYINGTLADSLKEKKIYFDRSYEIYITAKNDPNILIKTMIIPINELVDNYYYIIPFDNIDVDEVPISLYCRKLFTKYQYIKTKL